MFELTDHEGALNGPFNAMLVSPQLGDALQQLGAAVRYRSALSGRVREMAILMVAAQWDSDFERYAHEPVARSVGVRDGEIADLRAGRTPVVDDAAEAAALRLVAALLADQDVDDEIYAAVVPNIGERAAFELTTLVGYYATLALQLRVFRVGAPPGDLGAVDADGGAADTAGQ
jgi:4-carboxymuconolactone decarboxylase